MVLKIAGWLFNYSQVRQWLENQGQKHDDLEDMFLARDLNFWFKERHWDRDYLWAVPTDYPRGSEQPVIVLVRRRMVDPESSVVRFYRINEEEEDRNVKDMVLAESLLENEELPWVTIADPFFMYPHR